ncbi:hypothetical protein [Bifidobacterium longum]|uniref:Membrane-associated protein n=2 Tax=Bifidobacterium longum subsp. infantis TaxID=1682 RepID=A0ABM9R7I5_BIFLI|nr:hypothetical protein [Bifidobacterium longum]ACJ53316.1 conserved hypothetical protein [Bifidobacterium longum subsp. infantis ATCC 15697 = JCM 1222 = DSM 20088]MBX4250221.1 hypothetical protein [Bifidobacterium longum subsp. infantis]MEE4091197.1 hypothetical protein [Bifidobacterium longum subsp. infantis]CEF01831.1 hypothetical protein BLIC_a02425 [Bifidobacterium longum subsp. infantis]CEF05584.1 hypothetical protein BLIC_b02477 [Bifidobacterium longum subsp. infantis]
MGYESLSTVVVLVIVAIIIVVWLPVRTANGMKRVDEHRQDRYSPSLHIVDAENGRRFGDIKPYKAKGAAMPASTPSARLTPEHIAHVRELRRAAIRRRQILAVCLLAITVLVFAVSFPLHFSPLLALIPFVLLLLLLVLGANASRQARQWERKVVRYERTHSGTGWSKKPSAESKDSKRVNKAEPVAAVTAPAEQIEDAVTEVMEQRQIRCALRDAEIEQAKAKALRQSAAAYQAAAEHAKQSEKSDTAQSAADKPAAEPSAMVDESADRKSAAETSESSAAPDASARTDKSTKSDKSVAPRVEPSLTVRDERDERDDAAADATSELASVRPARALDVFDMATSQDLISFTLGGEHNADNAPESLEIKSTRQVSKAEPVEPAVAEKLIDEARAVKAADDAKAADAGKAVGAGNAVDTESEQRDDADTNVATDAGDEAANAAQRAAFHESEERADVEAPAATTDSLGAGLDSILARRGN